MARYFKILGAMANHIKMWRYFKILNLNSLKFDF